MPGRRPDVTDPVILRDQLNVFVHLRPAPVVARVAGTIARVRPGATWQRRELAIAGHLARVGAPVVAPSDELPPGPHEHDGHVISFWRYVPPTGEPVDPVAAGDALRECHEALRSFSGSLPVLSGVTEAEALLMKLAAEEALDRQTATTLLHRIEDLHATLGSLRSPIQPLHGDAHLNNVLKARRAAVERLGGHLRRPARLGRRVPEADPRRRRASGGGTGRLRHPPRPRGVELWVEARSLQVAVWRAFLATT